MQVRAAYLEAHPYCQWFIQFHKLDEATVIKHCGYVMLPNYTKPILVPLATEIHHRRGRVGSLLTDERYFLAVSHRGHLWIHNNPGQAYDQGFMLFR